MELVNVPGTPLQEGSSTNRMMMDVTGITTPNSGSATGDGLWDMSVWGSTREDCEGPRMGEQKGINTLSRYQQNKDVKAGEDLRLNTVDMNFDMTGLTCDDVRYICVELMKGQRPSPDFEMKAVPDNSVLKQSMRHECNGRCHL